MNKSVFAPGKELIVSKSVLVELGLNEGQRITAEQAIQIVKVTGRLAVGIKPQQDYENLPGSPH